MKRASWALVAISAFICCWTLPVSASADTTCTSGSDYYPGSSTSFADAVDALSSGQNLCLHDHPQGNTAIVQAYSSLSMSAFPTPPSNITIKAASGESPVVIGDVNLSSTTSGTTVSGLRINGRVVHLGPDNTLSKVAITPDQQLSCVDIIYSSTSVDFYDTLFEGCKTQVNDPWGVGYTEHNDWVEPNGWDSPPGSYAGPALIYRPFTGGSFTSTTASIWNRAWKTLCSTCTLTTLSSNQQFDLATKVVSGQTVADPDAAGDLTGVNSNQFSKPIYQANNGNTSPLYCIQACGDGTTSAIHVTSGTSIPRPTGLAAATGNGSDWDGHLGILSSNLHDAWDMWQCHYHGSSASATNACTESNVASHTGYDAETAAHWDLTGYGVNYDTSGGSACQVPSPPSTCYKHADSARESGLPLIDTTIRAHEALYGIHHAIGISTKTASGKIYYPPATHGDCEGSNVVGTGTLSNGELLVLDSSYTPPTGTKIGWLNVINALKYYGAYVDDAGASPQFELDADFNDPSGEWAKAGFNTSSGQDNKTPFKVSDFRVLNTTGNALPGQNTSNTETTTSC